MKKYYKIKKYINYKLDILNYKYLRTVLKESSSILIHLLIFLHYESVVTQLEEVKL